MLFNDVIASTPKSPSVLLFFHPSVFKIIELNLLAGEESFSSRLGTTSDTSFNQRSFSFFAVSFPARNELKTSWKTYFPSTALTRSWIRFTVCNFSNFLLWILDNACTSTESTSSLWKVFDNNLAGFRTSIVKQHEWEWELRMGIQPEVHFWYQC